MTVEELIKEFAEKYAKENNMIYELKILDKTRKERKDLLENLQRSGND